MIIIMLVEWRDLTSPSLNLQSRCIILSTKDHKFIINRWTRFRNRPTERRKMNEWQNLNKCGRKTSWGPRHTILVAIAKHRINPK
jgi:hypothetical protein